MVYLESATAEDGNYFRIYSMNCKKKDNEYEGTVKVVIKNNDEHMLVISDSKELTKKDIEKSVNYNNNKNKLYMK